MRSLDMTGITRIEQPARARADGHSGPYGAWWLRLGWEVKDGKKRPRFQRTFPDGEYGGCEWARASAIDVRDRVLRERDALAPRTGR